MKGGLKMCGSRVLTFDVLRFVAMFMVVFIHLLNEDIAKRPDEVSRCANFIIGCNMPLFFVISGYFGRRMIESLDVRKYLMRLAMYFVPMITFSIVNGILYSLVLEKTGFATIPMRIVKCFLFGGWFFYTLAICEGITLFMRYIQKRLRIPTFVGGFVAFLILLSLPVNVWYVNRVIDMFPYFLMGMFWLPFVWERRDRFVSVAACLFVAYFLLCVLEGNVRTNGLGFYWERITLLHSSVRDYGLAIARLMIGVLSSFSIIVLMDKLINCFSALTKLATLGTTTIGIYYMHGFVIRLLCRNEVVAWGAIIPTALLIYIGCHWVVVLSKRNRFLNVCLWGSNKIAK